MPLKTDRIPVVKAPRDLSAEAMKGFVEDIEAALAKSPEILDVDCSDLDPASSSHVSVLWSARETCEAAGVSMRLRNANQGLQRILEVLDLRRFFVLGESSVPPDKISTEPPGRKQAQSRLDLSLKSSSDQILDALHEFRQFLRGLKLSPMCSLELETIFYETLTNIRVHGQAGSECSVEFSAVAYRKTIELTFIDDGLPFDPSGQLTHFDPTEAIRNRQRRGFGLTMIARMTDSIDYERRDDKYNVVRLKKSRG